MIETLPNKIGNLVSTFDGYFTLEHPVHGQCYHSRSGAKFEADHLYIECSGIKEALVKPAASALCVLDVGLGLGYNALSTIDCWHETPQPCDLHLISFEPDPQIVEQLCSGSAPWQENWSEPWRRWVSAGSVSGASFRHPTSSAQLTWDIHLAGIYEVPAKLGSTKVDFIWHDPFSASITPELWDERLFRIYREHVNPDVCLMTFSVARMVKDHLVRAGWTYERIKTPIGKRHWLRARLAPAD